jgi:hypothetical protein
MKHIEEEELIREKKSGCLVKVLKLFVKIARQFRICNLTMHH